MGGFGIALFQFEADAIRSSTLQQLLYRKKKLGKYSSLLRQLRFEIGARLQRQISQILPKLAHGRGNPFQAAGLPGAAKQQNRA